MVRVALLELSRSSPELFSPFALILSPNEADEALVVDLRHIRLGSNSAEALPGQVVLVSDPNCPYTIVRAWDPAAAAGAFLQNYISELAGASFAVLLLTIARICKSWEETGKASCFEK